MVSCSSLAAGQERRCTHPWTGSCETELSTQGSGRAVSPPCACARCGSWRAPSGRPACPALAFCLSAHSPPRALPFCPQPPSAPPDGHGRAQGGAGQAQKPALAQRCLIQSHASIKLGAFPLRSEKKGQKDGLDTPLLVWEPRGRPRGALGAEGRPADSQQGAEPPSRRLDGRKRSSP